MTPLTQKQFPDFFRAVHGHKPFDWQKRLAKEVLERGWPDVINVPTACGKTCVLDLAIFELAMQADREPSQRTAARRIGFVVDRRLVIDEVAETECDPITNRPRGHAIRIRAALRAAAAGKHSDPVLRAVAERLKEFAADPEDLLRVVRLRGGVYRDDTWAADPLTPTILVSTVDQIGSRLLFRGYGVGPRSRPAHAGLLGFDTRIILDEAHLSGVFADTLDRIRHYEDRAERPPLPPTRRISIVRMSATVKHAGRVFELRDRERKDARLAPRLDASKPTTMVAVPVKSITKKMREEQPRNAREQEHLSRDEMVRKLVEQAECLAGSANEPPAPRVIGVVVNRVATARKVFERLRGQEDTPPDRDAILLTGRIRSYDRDRLLEQWLPRIRAGREAATERPLFVVATQTVEVGANLDFDVLVTEAAPLAALRQRFGRLNRLGAPRQSQAAIVIRSDQTSSTYDDPIYGSAVGPTWKWLSKSKRVVDFGINLLDSKLKKVKPEDLEAMETRQPDTPLMFPAHVDAWVQTDPSPEADPDVAPFLHGHADSAADVQVVWRADLAQANRESWKDVVTLMPPRSREGLPVPVYEVQHWLRNEAVADVADIEGPVIAREVREHGAGRVALRWRGSSDRQTGIVRPDDVRPGDTIVVPASYGGADAFGWDPTSKLPVADVAEQSLTQLIASYPKDAFRRPKLRLRLHPGLFPSPDEAGLRRLLGNATAAVHHEQEDPWPSVRRLLQALRAHLQEPERIAALDALLQAESPQIYPYPQREGVVVVAPVSISLSEAHATPAEDLDADEPMEDEASVVPNGCRITLAVHTDAVVEMSVAFAKRSGLHEKWSEQLTEAVRISALWHDQGKRDRRFQAWLHSSEIEALAALAADQPLAKSGRDPKHWKPSEAFGYPRGLRHEFVSIRFFEEACRPETADADLIKLLTGTHHGHGRALAPVVKDSRPVEVTLAYEGRQISVSSDHRLYRLGSGWTDLFWRMVRRYGWWGLAYLEALVVTADRVVSTREQRNENQAEAATT